MNDQTGKIVRLSVLLGSLALGLAACATPPVDPSSPVAAATAAASKSSRHAKKPAFTDIPAIPTDVRTPVQFKKAVGDEKLAAEQIKRETAPDTWTLSDTDGYASKARNTAKVPAPAAPTAADRAATEAFAKAARERATAPPSKPQ